MGLKSRDLSEVKRVARSGDGTGLPFLSHEVLQTISKQIQALATGTLLDTLLPSPTKGTSSLLSTYRNYKDGKKQISNRFPELLLTNFVCWCMCLCVPMCMYV